MFFNHYKSYAIIALLFCKPVFAVMVMPATPQNSIGGDAVRARDGTTCTQGSHVGPTLDFGVTGTQNINSMNSSQPNIVNNYYNGTQQTSTNSGSGSDIGVYARIIVPLGDEPERLDCTSLYSLEIERLKLELENLKKSGSSAVTVE